MRARLDLRLRHGRRRTLSRFGVAVAAVGLVAAVWISLLLSQTTADRRAEAEGSDPVPELGEVPGFLEDAWYLPDEELLGFVEVPAGPFTMGSDPAVDTAAFDLERWSPTKTQGTVGVDRFYIGRYEVTVAQYAAFVAATGRRVAEPQALGAPPDHPVAWVSWTDALAYAQWLGSEMAASDRTPPDLRQLLTDGWTVGLPSEAEWEKAARGDDGRLYPWGDQPRPERANFMSRGATPVGTFGCGECPYGLYDMAGNVWEWTRSPYQPYPYDPSDDREGLDADALWVMRGGSFADPPHFVRAANRGGADPGARRPFIGFRVVISRS